jgi:predicted DNA-binding transcriptional regulator AlpA
MSQGPFVPIEECAKHFTVSVSTIRSWIRQGFIPKDTYLKVGLTYRFDLSAIIAALSAHPDEELPEVPVEAVATGAAVVGVVAGTVAEVVMKEPVQLELNFNPDEDL